MVRVQGTMLVEALMPSCFISLKNPSPHTAEPRAAKLRVWHLLVSLVKGRCRNTLKPHCCTTAIALCR